MEAGKAGIEMVFQDFMLCPDLNVISNTFLGRETTGNQFLNNRLITKLLGEKLKSLKFDIQDIKKKVKFLLRGQQQMIAILRTLMLDPKIMLLDKPTANVVSAILISQHNFSPLMAFFTVIVIRGSQVS